MGRLEAAVAVGFRPAGAGTDSSPVLGDPSPSLGRIEAGVVAGLEAAGHRLAVVSNWDANLGDLFESPISASSLPAAFASATSTLSTRSPPAVPG